MCNFHQSITIVHIQYTSWGVGLELFHLLINSRGKDIKVHHYSQKFIDNFKLIVLNTLPKLTDQEKSSIATSFGSFSQDKNIENITKRILTHV